VYEPGTEHEAGGICKEDDALRDCESNADDVCLLNSLATGNRNRHIVTIYIRKSKLI